MLNAGVKYIGVENLRLSTQFAVYLGNGTHRSMVAIERQAADGSVSVPMTLSDLQRREARGQFFS